MARGEAISLTGRPFPNSSNDIAECGIPELLLRGLLAFAGFAVFQIDFGDISFLIVELGPDDRFAGFQRLGHIEDALVSGAAELQQRVLLVSEVAASTRMSMRCSNSSLSGVSPGRMSSSHV